MADQKVGGGNGSKPVSRGNNSRGGIVLTPKERDDLRDQDWSAIK